jgi:cytochrome P450 / NADPH-cytochrome P450 reductase
MAMMLQYFDVKLDDPAYKLSIKQNLTIKPADLYIRVNPRKNLNATAMDTNLHSNGTSNNDARVNNASSAQAAVSTNGPPLLILYGSNTGTCQAFAQRLASDAAGLGFTATIKDMDSATDEVPKNVPVIVITSSYEGQPPDNAARFVEWLQVAKAGCLDGVIYTVFGCGHRKSDQVFDQLKLTPAQMIGPRHSIASQSWSTSRCSNSEPPDSVLAASPMLPKVLCTATLKNG